MIGFCRQLFPALEQQPRSFCHLSACEPSPTAPSGVATMLNDQNELVDLYLPRKW